MRHLTHSEKQQLETKIEEEKERQQTLREMYPDTPEDSKETSAVTGFTSSYLWKYGFLAIILCLLAYSLFIQFKWRKFEYNEFTGLVVPLMLLFYHIAYYFTTKGWKSVVMKTSTWVWMVLGFAYFFGVLG